MLEMMHDFIPCEAIVNYEVTKLETPEEFWMAVGGGRMLDQAC